jgi:hypothetical protein
MADIKDPENTILMELKDGTVVIELLPDVAPKHSERMKELAREGAYDGVVFHRVIEGFMAQRAMCSTAMEGGNLRMAGTGGSDKPDLPAEFSKLPHDRGTLGRGAVAEPELGQQPVLHQFHRQPLPERAVHRLWPRHRRAWSSSTRSPAASRPRPRQDDLREGGRRCVS